MWVPIRKAFHQFGCPTMAVGSIRNVAGEGQEPPQDYNSVILCYVTQKAFQISSTCGSFSSSHSGDMPMTLRPKGSPISSPPSPTSTSWSTWHLGDTCFALLGDTVFISKPAYQSFPANGPQLPDPLLLPEALLYS